MMRKFMSIIFTIYSLLALDGKIKVILRGIPRIIWCTTLSVTVSIKVRRELVELADKMVRYGLASSRSHAFNLMIERGIKEVLKDIEFWDDVYRKVEEFERKCLRIEHGGLRRLLEEDRAR